MKENISAKPLIFRYDDCLKGFLVWFQGHSKSLSLQCKIPCFLYMMRALKNVFNKRKERRILGLNDTITLYISAKYNDLSDETLSFLNVPMNKSPKIKLIAEFETDFQKQIKINQTLFKILQCVDYIYKVKFNIEKSFDVSTFPLNKAVRIA